MRKLIIVAASVAALAVSIGASSASAAMPSCATIKGGTITDTAGNPITRGTDQFGYNYQAHSFNGTYDSSDRVLDGLYYGLSDSGDYADDVLTMKWSDSWLANVDCNNDGKLDRGLVDGVQTGGISRGWLTNHVTGDYTVGAVEHDFTIFDKIVWVGPIHGDLWGEYTIVQEVVSDRYAGLDGVQIKDGSPGFGQYNNKTTT